MCFVRLLLLKNLRNNRSQENERFLTVLHSTHEQLLVCVRFLVVVQRRQRFETAATPVDGAVKRRITRVLQFMPLAVATHQASMNRQLGSTEGLATIERAHEGLDSTVLLQVPIQRRCLRKLLSAHRTHMPKT